MTFELRVASRKKAKLRIGLSAPSGAGKTYSALLIAKGMAKSWDKVALIDTENGSGELYSHLGGYNVITLEAPYTPERYIEAISACERAGMEVIVIDSISHEWDGKGGILEANQKLADAKFKGNTWAAWSESTPRHQKLIEAITTSPIHIITTSRNKVDSIMTDDKKVKKVGTKEIQREGFEYELTLNFNIDRDTHMAMASKDRTELFENADPFMITEETGEKLLAWAESGEEDTTELQKADLRIKIGEALKEIGKDEAWLLVKLNNKPLSSHSIADMTKILLQVNDLVEKKKAKDAEIERQRKEEGRASAEEEELINLED